MTNDRCVRCGGELNTGSLGAICQTCENAALYAGPTALSAKEGAVLVDKWVEKFDTLPKWEYMVLTRADFSGEKGISRKSLEDTLNEFGEDGWELVSFTMKTHKDELYVLKREV